MRERERERPLDKSFHLECGWNENESIIGGESVSRTLPSHKGAGTRPSAGNGQKERERERRMWAG